MRMTRPQARIAEDIQTMVNGLLGKKIGMTRVFTQDGQWIPVTVIQVGPCTVVQRKTAGTDGYEAVQLGFVEKKEQRCVKPLKGHFSKMGVSPKQYLTEFHVPASSELKSGDEIRSDIFQVGEMVDVTGTSKGRGFAGVVRRHHYSGGPGTHGSNFHRAPGSIGQSAYPSEVIKGKGLPGHMGHERVTLQNLEVVDVNNEKSLILVRGAVPGANGGLLTVRHSVKGRKKGSK